MEQVNTTPPPMQQKSKEEIINILLNNEHGSLESDGTVSKAGMILRNQYPDIADKITSQYRSQPTSEEYKLETGDGYGTTYGASQPPHGTASGGYSLEQVEKIALEAAKYGFNYRDISQHNGEVPEGNVLQWLQNFLQPETKLTPHTKTE